MRLLADENIPIETVRALRSAGHDVFSATEGGPGTSDLNLVDRAVSEERLIVTFDRDFGELAIRGPRKPTSGVLLLRIIPRSAEHVTEFVRALLAREDVVWVGQLSVADETHLRQRPI